MAGNESKINKRNNNFDNNFNCSLFLISIRHMMKKKLPRISEAKSRMTQFESHEKWGQRPSQPLPLRGACLIPCTGHTSVCHSATDANEGYILVSKSSIFRTLFPRLLKLYTVVYISWCRSVLRWSSDSRISPLVKETAKPETISTTSWSCRCLKVYINSSISLHTTPVYWVWVSVYRCLYFVAAFSLNLHWSWLQSCCILHQSTES